MKNSYVTQKELARQKAIDWQVNFDKHNYSWQECAEWMNYFAKLGKRYGLTEEFRENGII